MTTRVLRSLGAIGLVVVVAGCSGSSGAPTSPSAATPGSTNAAADGSTLKTTAPALRAPAAGATASATPNLLADATVGRFWSVTVQTLRFQVSESSTFGALTDEGTAIADVVGLATYRVQRAQRPGVRVYWRARGELDGAVGPWSEVRDMLVSGSAAPPPGPGGRTPDPPAGQRLPLPNVQTQIAQWTAERPDLFPSQQCPRGIKYVNSPWQDYIMDRLRQVDTRWGYNAKPTRTAADNGGVPVVAAGDEILYHYSAGADQGSTEVYAVDILEQHCGTPRLTWRVFTGEEPVIWTGAGRF